VEPADSKTQVVRYLFLFGLGHVGKAWKLQDLLDDFPNIFVIHAYGPSVRARRQLVGLLIEGKFETAQLAAIHDVVDRLETVGGANGILARRALPRHAPHCINLARRVCAVQITRNTLEPNAQASVPSAFCLA
jgi:hypothetical protein